MLHPETTELETRVKLQGGEIAKAVTQRLHRRLLSNRWITEETEEEIRSGLEKMTFPRPKPRRRPETAPGGRLAATEAHLGGGTSNLTLHLNQRKSRQTQSQQRAGVKARADADEGEKGD